MTASKYESKLQERHKHDKSTFSCRCSVETRLLCLVHCDGLGPHTLYIHFTFPTQSRAISKPFSYKQKHLQINMWKYVGVFFFCVYRSDKLNKNKYGPLGTTMQILFNFIELMLKKIWGIALKCITGVTPCGWYLNTRTAVYFINIWLCRISKFRTPVKKMVKSKESIIDRINFLRKKTLKLKAVKFRVE
jgi:hypothetical protein